MHPNAALIDRFYRAFQQRDAAAMAACYHTDVHFSDPAFPNLRGAEAGKMWTMLCARGKDLRIEFTDVVADDATGSARWDAWYTFSATGRKVHNRIHANFQFKDGLIVRHIDRFNFWRWSRQALGPVGLLLGWSPLVANKVRRGAAASLAAWRVVVLAMATALGASTLGAQYRVAPQDTVWPVHSMERPKPAIVAPGRMDSPASRPADAIVLFDGSSLDAWQQGNGSPAAWRLVDGAMEVVGGSGSIQTKREFGSVQLHVEWRTAPSSTGTGQGKSNSGIFLMGRYEVQVLDSYRNETYADGQAASLYGQFPPLVNASRPPGEWQVYEILFRRPVFDASGQVVTPARVTVVHNGVVVHVSQELYGATTHIRRAAYTPHGDRGPLGLQDHGDPVQFRNIWVRELPDR